MPGFTCPSYSTVPRLVALLNDGRIFQMKVGEEAVWTEISIFTAEPETYGVSPLYAKLPEVKKLNKKTRAKAKK